MEHMISIDMNANLIKQETQVHAIEIHKENCRRNGENRFRDSP